MDLQESWKKLLSFINRLKLSPSFYSAFVSSELAYLTTMAGGDGIFTYRDGIAVAQIVSFSVPLILAVQFRCTYRIGWFLHWRLYLTPTYWRKLQVTIHNDSQGVWAAIFVCESLGMILILFLLLEILERM